MNLDLDLSVVSRFFRGFVTELRQKKLWPVAALLLVALVAAPILLAKSASPTPPPRAQLPASQPQGGTSIPALNVQTTPSHSHLNGSSHDPFAGNATTGAPTSSAAASPAAAASTASSTAAGTASTLSSGGASTATPGNTGSSSSGSTSSGTPASPTTSSPTNPPSSTPNAKPKPAPSGLTKTQAYSVSLTITDSSGGVVTGDPLARLSVLPSQQQPLLVELGVAQGGDRVLFAVQPGAVLSGPGTCIPGPIDCEVLSLGKNQTEGLSEAQGSLGTSQVALFAVTGIRVTNYASAAIADSARRTVSQAGRALLDKSSSSALSLFQYEPSLGVVVDLRNLKVQG